MKHLTVVFAVLLLGSAGGCRHGADSDPFDIVLPYEWGGDIDQVDFREPSGITWHAERGTLFLVGDEGQIVELKTDGTPVQQGNLPPADYEGITSNPATGLLYVIIEEEEQIVELESDGFRIRRRFNIDRHFDGRLVMKRGGEGIEAITFVADPEHAHGGTFFVANQAFTLDDAEDVSAIFEIELPLNNDGAVTAETLRMIPLPVIDASALHYDEATDSFFFVSDAQNAVFRMDRGGRVVESFALAGADQEGITFDPEGWMYIAQDSGGVLRIRPRWPATQPSRR